MVSLSNIKCILLILLVTVGGCKTSPVEDTPVTNSESSSASSVTTTSTKVSSNSVSPGVSDQELVVSTADAGISPSPMLSDYTVASGEFNIFPRETSGWDTNGWSILTPQEDSRLIYVSSSVGDDANGEIYAPRDIADVQNPGLIKPFKTIASAIEHAREGYPDWILLQKGDEWEVPARIELRMGRSIQERSVITSYGTSTKRPTISNSEGKEMLRVWSEHS